MRFKNYLKSLNNLDSLKKLKDNYIRNLNYARKIQMALLPKELPSTDRYEFEAYYSPAEIIGGDIYDVILYENQYLIFYIADVAGHGVPAAMLTVFVREALKITSTVLNKTILNSPMQVLKELNKKLIDAEFEGSPQVTIFYCIYSLDDKILTYSSAGHHPAVLLRDERKDLLLLGEPSVPLGWFEDIKFYEEEFTLKENDKLLLFTDGLFENLPGIEDGYEFINKILVNNKKLSLKKIIKKMVSERNKIANKFQDDDIAILGFNVKK